MDYESTALTAELRARMRSKALQYNNFPQALSIVSASERRKKGICVIFASVISSGPPKSGS